MDDAIKASVNGGDLAGWTQEDYDRWSEARELGERALGERGDA